MKVYEVLEKKQLNEALPLIGGIGLGGILTAISVGIAAWSAYDIYNFIKKYNEDPEQITDEQWEELFIDAILVFTPGFLKLGRVGVAKLVPKVAKTRGGKWLRTKISKRYAEVAAKRAARGKYSIQGLKGKQRLEMLAKRAAASSTAASAATAAMKANASFAALIRILGAGAVISNYLIQIAAIEEDFNEIRDAEKSGKEISDDNIFKGMNVEQAQEHGRNLRQDLLGEAALQLAGLGIGARLVAKPAEILSNFGLLGKVLAFPFNLAKWTMAFGGTGAKATAAKAALTAWLSTDSGIEFLKQTSIGLLIYAAGLLAKSALGWALSWSIDSLVTLLDEALAYIGEKIGVNLSVPDAAKSPFSQTSTDKATQDALAQRQANIKYLKGIPITGPDGYLLATRDFWLNPKIKNIIDIELGKQRRGDPNAMSGHPLAGVPLNPKIQYPTDLMAKLGFTPS